MRSTTPPAIIMALTGHFPLLIFLSLTHSTSTTTNHPVFTPNTSVTLQKMTLDHATGDIYIGATNQIYHLSPDLALLDQATIGPQLDHPLCFINQECKYPKTLKTEHVKVLLLHKQNRTLLVCGTVYRGLCLKMPTTNLSHFTWVESQSVVRWNEDPQYRPTVALLNNKDQLFIGTSVNTDSSDYQFLQSIPLVSTRTFTSLEPSQSLTGGSFLSIEPGEDIKLIHRYGFSYNGYFYSITNQQGGDYNVFNTYISRVCQADRDYRSYVEAELFCDSRGVRYGVLTAAHFGVAGPTLTNILGLDDDEPLLYGVFGDSVGVDLMPRSAVCVYRMRQIDELLIRAVQECFSGSGSTGPRHLTRPTECITSNMKIPENYCGEQDLNFPIRSSAGVGPVVRSTIVNVSLSAVLSSTLGRDTLLYMGTKSGTLLKATVEAHTTVQVYDTVQVDPGRPILPDLLISTAMGGVVYAMSNRKVARLEMSCDDHVTCDRCMTSADPHCGWCFQTNRCLSESLCHSETEFWGWVATRQGSCPAISQTTPDLVPIGSSTEVDLWLTELPDFPQHIECVIGGSHDGDGDPPLRVATRRVDGTNRFTCLVGTDWPKLPPNQHFLSVPVYFEVNRERWLSTNITLYDCQHYTTCSSCSRSVEPCAWCLQSQRCTDSATVSQLEKCGLEHFIYSTNASPSAEFPDQGPQFCPSFDAITNHELLLHSNIEGDIHLKANHIPKNFKTFCRIGGKEFSASVEDEGGQHQIICQNVKLRYHEEKAFHSESIQVLLGQERKVPIDNPKNVNVTLYSCEHMAVSCGQCLTLDPVYGCGQCEVYCSHQQACPTTWLNKHNVCPNPQITRIYPVAGPLGGGTLLTIHGVDLGQEEEHVKNGVKVAGQPCQVVSYTPSTNIECLTSAILEGMEGKITVTVSNNASEKYTATATTPFTYVDPVMIAIHPERGPRSGGSKLTMTGQHLDIGSVVTIETQTLEDEGNASRRRREVGQARTGATNIKRDADSIIFTSPRIDDQGNVTFVVVMDGNRFTSDDVMFSYVADPTITHVTDLNTLTSGGAELEVRGERINLIQDPRLIIYVKDANATSPCYYKPNMTDLYCMTPDLTRLDLDPGEMILTYGFIMDGVTDLLKASDSNPHLGPLSAYPAPTLDLLGTDLRYTENEPLEFFGSHLNVLELFPGAGVTVGGAACNISLLQSDQILCYLPSSPTQLSDGRAQVLLTVLDHQMSPGSVIIHNVGVTLVKLLLIIGAVALPILLIIILLACCLRRQNKKEQMKKAQLQIAGGIEDPAAVPLNVVHTTDRIQPGKVSEETPLRGGEERGGETEEREPEREAKDDGFGSYFDAQEGEDEKVSRMLGEVQDPRLRRTIEETLIPSSRLTLGEVLGKGHFGCVYSGVLASAYTPDDKVKVAVKTIQGRHFEAGMVESFLKEGVMMKNFDHPHVLELLGVSLGDLPMVVLPYMAQGDLRTYVKNKQKNFTARQLLHLAQQVAQGMAYLASRHFVHRDLAARNCMIDEDEQVKVADFGLSKDLYEKDYYCSKDRKRKLPIKWMALESLEDYIFTTKSDVWSFGVLMWELITRGVTPYPDVDAFEMRNYLASGRRLRQPKFCPDNAYILMAECWRTRPEDRPTFADLVNRLELIVNPPRRLNSTSSDEPLYMNIQRQPSLPNEIEEER